MNNLHVFLIILAASAILLSCDRHPDENAPYEREQQTSDALQVRTSLCTYIFEHSYEHSSKALVNRIENRATDMNKDVQAVMLHNVSAMTLEQDRAIDIVRLLARGGSLVYCEPTKAGLDAFIRNLRSAIPIFYKNPTKITPDGLAALNYITGLREGIDGQFTYAFADDDDRDGIICDILAARGNGHFIVTDLDDITETKTRTSTGSTLESENAGDALTDYVYGLHADKLAKWLEERETADAIMRKGEELLTRTKADGESQELDKITNAQKITYSFNVCAGYKCAPLTVSYEIWTAHDGKGSDYYLIHQELRIENSKLDCGPEDMGMNQWATRKVPQAFAGLGKDVRAYWAYMTRLGTQTELSDGNAAVEHVSPANNISGVTDYTENLSWSLEGAFVASATPSLKLTGNVSMSKSWTHSIPDLGMTFTYDKNKPKWEYTAGVLPKLIKDKYFDPRHDLAKPILKNDCTVGHSWIWRAGNASGSYTFKSRVWADLQGLYVDYNDAYQKKNKYKTFPTENSKTLGLNPPPRFQQEWIMTMSPYNEQTAKLMTTYFPDYWLPSFSLYTVEENDKSAIDAQIAATQAVLEENQAILEENKVASFTLNWKLLHGSEIYKSYTYTAKK